METVVPGVTPDTPLIPNLPEVDNFQSLLSSIDDYIVYLMDSITPDDILIVLASVVGVGMAFFLGWLGVRKATRTFTTALSTGKIKI